MRSATRWLLASLVLAVAGTALADDGAYASILRDAALRHGLRPAQQLFDDTDANLAQVGRTFFHSQNVSLNGRIACATCHLDEFSSTDGLANAIGIHGEGEGPVRAMSSGKIVPRNTLPLWARGARGFDVFFWDGKVDFSRDQTTSQYGNVPPSPDALLTAVHLPPVEIREMLDDDEDVSRYKQESASLAQKLHRRIVRRLQETENAAMTELAVKLGKPVDGLTFHDVARSMAAFIRFEFRLHDTPFHDFVFGQGSLTRDQLQGGIVFYGKGKCANCHTGPYFSDLRFHAVPVPQLGFGKNGFGVDYGRFNVTFDPADLYRFRTPPLINATETAPYGHAGSLPTLRDTVVAHFDPLRHVETRTMEPLARHELFRRMAAVGDEFMLVSHLTDAEVDQVTEFLATLTFEVRSGR